MEFTNFSLHEDFLACFFACSESSLHARYNGLLLEVVRKMAAWRYSGLALSPQWL